MTGSAALYPNTGELQTFGMRAAYPVVALPINAAGESSNWIMGRGTPLVVDGGHWWFGSGSVTRVTNYRVYLDALHPTFGVYVTMHAVNAPSLPVSINGDGYVAGSLPTVVHFPLENDVGTAEKDIALTFNFNGDVGDLMVDSIYVYECPVSLIDGTGSAGIPARSQIYDGSADYRSISGVERVVEDLRTLYFRKGALFNWASGIAGSSGGVLNSTTTYESLHPDGIKPAVQTRLMYSGETVRKARCSVMARVTGGTGNVRITMASGDTATFNVTSTFGNGVWHTSQDIDVETNDPSLLGTNGGIRGSSRDTVTIEWRASAAQSCRLYAVSIWDAPGD